MKKGLAKNIIELLLHSINVQINGNNDWDIIIHQHDLYERVLHQGALGLGEAYVEGWWDCPRLDILFTHLLRAQIDEKINLPFHLKLKYILAKFINFQTKKRALQVGKKHYDLGNMLFSVMLDKYMIYSCAYWKDAKNLDDAQIAKLELICQKLQLKAGETLLDIGCGWGGLAKYAAEKYGVNVIGITISKEQCLYAQEFCKNLPIKILLMDYRDLNAQFDKIVSVGMFEHVGHLNYSTYINQVERLLKDNGLFLLHTIGLDFTTPLVNEWTSKYIFPNGMLPSIALIAKALEKKFVVEDWHNFGAYYDPTLMSWYHHFNEHWESLKKHYDKEFYRLWSYYLLSSAGAFRSRTTQLWQIVLSKKGVVGGYVAPR